MKLITVLTTFFLYSILHDGVAKHFYCKRKKEKDNKGKCYYWNCSEWHTCPYNGGLRKL